MIYLTGDTHGRFERIGAFCDKMQTDRDDILIILGDAGINFHADARDILRKEYLARLPITLFCIKLLLIKLFIIGIVLWRLILQTIVRFRAFSMKQFDL